MNNECSGDDQPWKSKAVANLLHRWTGRAKGRRGNIRPAVAVDDTSNRDIDSSHSTLAYKKRTSVESRIAHFRYNREEPWCTGVRKYDRGDCSNSARKRWTGDELIIGFPNALLQRGCWAILNANGYSNGQD